MNAPNHDAPMSLSAAGSEGGDVSMESNGQLCIGGESFPTARPHHFGLVILGPSLNSGADYLHDYLLTPNNRANFLELVENEGLVVCKNVVTDQPSYRKVRGKSSGGKLSQAEYYHHDGCSCPTKPRIVEIRLPHQKIDRKIATAIAPLPNVIQAMMAALPDRLRKNWEREFGPLPLSELPPATEWDGLQGRLTRLARKELDAEGCRSYFREVDRLAGAYVVPWEMGESRLMLNAGPDLDRTMQHRRSYQQTRAESAQNGSLVKRWTAEEYF